MLASLLYRLQCGLKQMWSFIKPRRKLGVVGFIIVFSLAVAAWFAATEYTAAFWDTIIKGLASLLLALAGFLIKVSIFFLRFVIEIGAYNGYVDSIAVNVGWVMVRDIANMFFVVIMLIIAFATILGREEYEWKKLLTKVVFAAIIVNFSRTICGAIIGVAQVVMITFINGIAATAGGNLINMFEVDNIMSFSSTADPQSIAADGIFLASVAALVFAVMMMMTMATFVIMLLMRMVKLWILIVLSPLAFVLNILPDTKKFAGTWWSEFGGNVASGPVIAFFLWLSFVTVGSGNIHDEILRGTEGLPEYARLKETPQNTTGITEIMTWDAMANFAIAIGMLLAGAQAASQLGAAGASMMSKAAELGKKVAFAASGIAAGRWVAGKAVSGVIGAGKKAGKFALMKAPLIGGEVWKRRGENIKNLASDWYRKNIIAPRVRRTNERIDVLYGKPKPGEKPPSTLAKIKARLGLWFLAPEAFKKEHAGDLEEATKLGWEMLEHEASTSKTPWGLDKLAARRRIESLKKTGEQIKAEKEAGEDERRKAVSDLINTEKADGSGLTNKEINEELAKRDLPTLSNVEFEEARFDVKRKKRARMGGLHAEEIRAELESVDKAKEVQEREKRRKEAAVLTQEERAAAAKAEAEYRQRDIEKEKELEIARAKDKELTDRGQLPRFEAATRASHVKEVEDQLAALTFRELTEQIGVFAERMQELSPVDERGKKVSDLINTGKSDEEINAELKKAGMELLSGKDFEEARFNVKRKEQYAKSISAALTLNMKKGSEFGVQAFNKGLEALEISKELRAGDMQGAQAKVMSLLVGRKVGVDGLDKAWKDVENIHGKENLDIVIRNLNEALKHAAGDGAVNFAGLFDDTEIDKKTGRAIYKLEENVESWRSNRKYFAESVNPRTITGLKELIGRDKEGNFAIDDQSIEQLEWAFGGLKRGTPLQPRLINEFTGMIKKDDKGNVQRDAKGFAKLKITEQLKKDFQRMFNKFAEDKPDAAEAMLGNLGIFTHALVEGAQRDQYKYLFEAIDRLEKRKEVQHRGGERERAEEEAAEGEEGFA